MSAVRLERWAAWAPGLDSHEAWRQWAQEPQPLAMEGKADIGFLPALQRRRCDGLARAMLRVAHACLATVDPSDVATVFASRHGGFHNMVSMLDALAEGKPLSPARFSHSVHNTPAGLFSIWAGNRCASNSISAGPATFIAGFLESVAMLQSEPRRPVLLVCGDESIPAPMDAKSDRLHGIHAVALLFEPAEAGADGFEVKFESSDQIGEPTDHADPIEFIRWYLGDQPSLQITHPPHSCRWSRTSARRPLLEDD